MVKEHRDIPISLDRLREWMDGQGLGSGPLTDCVSLTGGTQNILLSLARDGETFVFRSPPAHPTANGNDTMRKEMRVLEALANSDVPHPRLIAGCPGEDVLGSAFYLMEPVDGFNATVSLPPLHAADAQLRRQMGFALIDGVLALSRVDFRAVGLAGLGKPEGFLERQVPRWLLQLEGYGQHIGWPGPSGLPHLDAIARWLETNRPNGAAPGIMHGDYHLANVMFRHDGPNLAAIVDWELATVGDPLLDLAWILAGWPGPDAAMRAMVTPWEGFPSADELIDHYRAGSDRDLSAIGWYRVLACFKLGILLEGTYARACAGKANAATGDMLHATALQLFERAGRLAAGA
ncbi:MAG: phosphotransferase family protein [Sphingobium sp.]